jgi:hypothetical protein
MSPNELETRIGDRVIYWSWRFGSTMNWGD